MNLTIVIGNRAIRSIPDLVAYIRKTQGSQAAVAATLGWSPQRLNYSLQHPDRMRVSDVGRLLKAIGLFAEPKSFYLFLPVDPNDVV